MGENASLGIPDLDSAPHPGYPCLTLGPPALISDSGLSGLELLWEPRSGFLKTRSHFLREACSDTPGAPPLLLGPLVGRTWGVFVG